MDVGISDVFLLRGVEQTRQIGPGECVLGVDLFSCVEKVFVYFKIPNKFKFWSFKLSRVNCAKNKANKCLQLAMYSKK